MENSNVRALIVDDDPHAISLLKKHLVSFPFIHVLKEVNSGKAAMDFLRQQRVDLLFLDIEMGDINGLELADHIQSIYGDIMIIFITGHAGFALEGYDYHPIDFLTKPIDFFRFEKTMQLVKAKIKDVGEKKSVPNAKIGMKVSGGIRIVNVRDILFIEKKGRKISIVFQDKESFYSSDSMRNLEQIYQPFGFFRAHQSFIVPIHHIKAIVPDTLTRSYTIQMAGGVELPLSRNKYRELKDLLGDAGISIF